MEINIREYWIILRKRLWLVVLCVLVSTLLGAMYGISNYRPVYQASTKLIVNKTVELDQMGMEQIDYAAIGINIALINTYKEIIKTPAIMDKVLQRYPDIDLTTDQLISIINVSGLNTTQVMTISAQHVSYEMAVKIVNAVSEVFRTEIPKIMKIDNVTILNSAKLKDNPVPVNPQSNQYMLIGFALSLVAAVGLILLLEAMDNTLKTDEDIRSVLDVPALAVVPVIKAKEFKASKAAKLRKKAGEAPYAVP